MAKVGGSGICSRGVGGSSVLGWRHHRHAALTIWADPNRASNRVVQLNGRHRCVWVLNSQDAVHQQRNELLIVRPLISLASTVNVRSDQQLRPTLGVRIDQDADFNRLLFKFAKLFVGTYIARMKKKAAKRGRGRPATGQMPIPSIRLSSEDWASIMWAAEVQGETASQYIRRVTLKDVKRVQRGADG